MVKRSERLALSSTPFALLGNGVVELAVCYICPLGGDGHVLLCLLVKP